MNVLLAEAQVPYEQLIEMDEINGEFKNTDVVLVVGANDVVNPAAKTTPGAPIYGMPILNADEAKQVVFMKRSMRPGFAGIENELLFEPPPRCSSATPRTRSASCSTRSRRCDVPPARSLSGMTTTTRSAVAAPTATATTRPSPTRAGSARSGCTPSSASSCSS